MLRRLMPWLSPARRAARHIARGRRAEESGRFDAAREHYRSAIAADPASAEAHLNLGVALETLGDVAGAMASYEVAVARDPGNAYAAYNLGKALLVRGDLGRAEALLRAAVAGKRDFAEALVVLARVLDARGDLEGAAGALEEAIGLRPDYAGALRNLGALRSKQQRWDDAAAALKRAIEADSTDADARCELGNVQMHLNLLEEAAGNYRHAIALRPGHAQAHWLLGNVLAEQGRRAEAAGLVRRALALDSRLVDAHIGLGNLHAAEFSYQEAAACYRAALALEPKHPTALANLGVALHLLGDAAGAKQALDAALALEPEHAPARWARAMVSVPVMRDADSDLGALRAEFRAALASLERWFAARPDAAGYAAVGTLQPFWIAYQAENNVALLSDYGRLCSRLMEDWLNAAGSSPRPARKAGPLRVGIVSQHFRRHSIWSALIKGWMQGLDRERFALYGFSLGTVRDTETQYAESRARQFVHGPRPLRQWVDAIREAQPDVLIYPEIGIDATTVRLASLRLAPLQATSWGHPETSGLPTIDCYLSAQDFEPEGAAAHYSERLVVLPHLSSYLAPGEVGAAPADLARWGLADDTPLLVCPGTPFKYAPEFDHLFPAIARRLGRCRFMFFQSGLPGLSDRLRQRLAATFAREGLEFDAHVSFIPWLPQAEFHGLMRRADAMLDTIGFSGFNTALQAVECGLPIVTREGRFLRGRLASGILKRIGLPEMVVADEEQYIGLAVRLARDAGYREDIRQRMQAGLPAVFEDTTPIRALEDFLAQGV